MFIFVMCRRSLAAGTPDKHERGSWDKTDTFPKSKFSQTKKLTDVALVTLALELTQWSGTHLRNSFWAHNLILV